MKDREAPVIGGAGQGMATSLVGVRVIDTDEKFMISRSDRLR
jgi:hypothetical protein